MNQFDAAAVTWDQQARHHERAELLAKSLRDLGVLNPKARVFEYGCGTGLLSMKIASEVKELVAADSSTGMIKEMQEKLNAPEYRQGMKNVKAVLLDLEKDEPLESGYDVILTSMTLHHVKDLQAVLKKCYQMTNNGGRFCIADLDEEDGSFHRTESVPHNGFCRKALSKCLREAGYSHTDSRALMTLYRETPDGEENEFTVFLLTAYK